MAGDKKNAANKANARKSTGPKSAEGKSVSARNALKHGLSLAPPPDAVRRELACILGAVTDLPTEASDDPSFGAA